MRDSETQSKRVETDRDREKGEFYHAWYVNKGVMRLMFSAQTRVSTPITHTYCMSRDGKTVARVWKGMTHKHNHG